MFFVNQNNQEEFNVTRLFNRVKVGTFTQVFTVGVSPWKSFHCKYMLKTPQCLEDNTELKTFILELNFTNEKPSKKDIQNYKLFNII